MKDDKKQLLKSIKSKITTSKNNDKTDLDRKKNIFSEDNLNNPQKDILGLSLETENLSSKKIHRQKNNTDIDSVSIEDLNKSHPSKLNDDKQQIKRKKTALTKDFDETAHYKEGMMLEDVDYKTLEKTIDQQIDTATKNEDDQLLDEKKLTDKIFGFFKKHFKNESKKVVTFDENIDEEVQEEIESENIDNEQQAVSSAQDEEEKLDKNIAAIKIDHFTKGFSGFVAVNNANFEVDQGVIHGFLGPNGSGKTTIIKSIIGSLIPSRGKILVYGHKAGTVKAKQLIGYIPEAANFPRYMKALEYIVNMARLSGVNKNEAIKISEGILKELNIWQFRFKRPSTFSSGMKKKILLAQALIHDPRILILDEPAENLDPYTRKILYDDLVKLRNKGKTIFISSHVLAELNDIVDEATFIKYGHVLFSGKIKPLLSERWGEYLIDSTDNKRLSALLIKRGIPCKQSLTGVMAKIGTDSQVTLLLNDLLDKNILLKNFQTHKVNLQQIYNEWIGEVNE
ncbi:ABC transporter ATP-binding protein [Mycoplasma sp. SG1]|uniref:ABC transporter ATP-binding protein n=1 Tax=Mycoplasma sp. SG1 TaxID=2810348 RepID=UPI002024914B|nr:ABC transporter ATP-binding protein [Mycoplasma sp. SG1]URM52925.1 ABC transporter ATP-binding protein [Mycoplasma sp. SG1]